MFYWLGDVLQKTGWWFQIFIIFIPTWGSDPIWVQYFSDGWFNHQLEKHGFAWCRWSTLSAFQKDVCFTTVFYQSEHFILFGQHAADKAPSCRSGGLFDFLRLGVYLPTRYGWWFRNPANQLRLVVFPIICGALWIPGGCLGCLPWTV